MNQLWLPSAQEYTSNAWPELHTHRWGMLPAKKLVSGRSVVQMRSKRDFVHEEDVRTGRKRGWMNVAEGLELHKNLLSPAEQEIFIQAIKDWEAQGRRVSHSSALPLLQSPVLTSRRRQQHQSAS